MCYNNFVFSMVTFFILVWFLGQIRVFCRVRPMLPHEEFDEEKNRLYPIVDADKGLSKYLPYASILFLAFTLNIIKTL